MNLFLPQGLEPVTWSHALDAVKVALAKVPGSEMKAIAGKLADAESLVALKDFMNRLG